MSWLLCLALLLTSEGNHSDSLHMLSFVNPQKGDELVLYQFLKMSDYYSLNKKDEAKKWAQAVQDSFTEVPTRYYVIAELILRDIDHWDKAGTLDDICRDMKISKNRLVNGKIGKETQIIQKVIIDKLDKLIKEKEDLLKQPMKADPNITSDGRLPIPLEESVIAIEQGKGITDDKHLKVIREAWGNLPEKDKIRVINGLTKSYPPKYARVIEDFFKALATGK